MHNNNPQSSYTPAPLSPPALNPATHLPAAHLWRRSFGSVVAAPLAPSPRRNRDGKNNSDHSKQCNPLHVNRARAARPVRMYRGQ